MITVDNFPYNYPLLSHDTLTQDERYMLDNLYQYLVNGRNYNNIANNVSEALVVANRCVIRDGECVRLDMNMNNPKDVSFGVKLGRDIVVGDILPLYRTCESGLPVWFTVDRFENGYACGRDLGMRQIFANEHYLIGK